MTFGGAAIGRGAVTTPLSFCSYPELLAHDVTVSFCCLLLPNIARWRAGKSSNIDLIGGH